MKTVAIIPARGGSKGIPRKNIRLLAGNPLITYTIKSAQKSRYISRIIVSTDDPEIAEISKDYGAEVIWRPAEISSDTATSEAALVHALEYLKKKEDYHPDIVVFLQCTSPLTTSEDIDGTIQTLIEKDGNSAFTVTPFHYFLWKQDHNEEVIGINHNKNIRIMRQQQEPQYVETGAVYVMQTEGFLKSKHRFFGKIVFHITPPERHWEIDEPIDFQIAEILMLEQNMIQKIQALPNPLSGIVMDFDGIFTDNKVIVHEDGSEAVICDRSDGLGLNQMKYLNIPLLVISTEKNPVVQIRCKKLEIPCKNNVPEKMTILKEWLDENKLNPKNVIYVGNDINDLSCMQYVGCGIAVRDAYPVVKGSAKITLTSSGGDGAIRELCDMIRRQLK
jgi:N-acylneuraminate cytidylyltransferase